jgi:hypothetical protein
MRPWLQTFSNKGSGKASECPGVIWEMYRNPKRYKLPKVSPRSNSEKGGDDLNQVIQANVCVLNHFERDYLLVTKHGLYWSLRSYFESRNESMPCWLPETYHVGCESEEDPKHMLEWQKFSDAFHRHQDDISQEKQRRGSSGGGDGGGGAESGVNENKLPDIFRHEDSIHDLNHNVNKKKKKGNRRKSKDDDMTNVWIAKPASLSNRGIGIKVVTSLEQVSELLDNMKERTRAGYIVQKVLSLTVLLLWSSDS